MNTINHVTLDGVTKYIKDSAGQAMLAPEELTLTAANVYAVGDLFRYDGKLYKVNAVIEVGDTIEVGTNCEETTIAGENIKDVQVDGTSVVINGVANVPLMGTNEYGVARVSGNAYGIGVTGQRYLYIIPATDAEVKLGTYANKSITPSVQDKSVFYGLAKAAGDATQAASDNAVGTYTDEAKVAIRTMIGAVGNEDYATASNYGIIKLGGGLTKDGNGFTVTDYANSSVIKSGAGNRRPITPAFQHESVFYGLAAAAGDTTQKTASTFVGTYTDNAKASIKAMLGIQDGSTGTVDISGTDPVIAAVENTRYVCNEITSLSFTPPASGISIVRFTSGSTVTVLTIPNTVKFPEWFDPTSLETNTIYEICITDGIYGAVMSWAL